MSKMKLGLPAQMAIGMVAGLAIGFLAQGTSLGPTVFKPMGDIFIKLIRMGDSLGALAVSRMEGDFGTEVVEEV